jgi:hypothetical protein
MDAFGAEHMRPDYFDQWHQCCGRRSHPVCERRDIEIYPFAFIDGALSIERQMQAVLGEQDVGEELWPRPTPRDRVRWRWRLRDCLARPAGELLAHVLNHFPLPRNEF